MGSERRVLIFPGLDALFLASHFRRWLPFPEIQSSLAEASDYLSRLTGQPENLQTFLETQSRPHLADFDRTLVSLTALQIGISRSLALQGVQWTEVLGCSHGDIARLVICDSLDYDHAIAVLWLFADLRKRCPSGSTANVRAVEGELTEAHLGWLAQREISVSQWSNSHATIGADTATLESLMAEGRSQGLKIKPVLPYPVHSKVMAPVVDELRIAGAQWPLRPPKLPIHSSVYLRTISEPAELVQEALDGTVSPIRWKDAIEHLYGNLGLRDFINVGPCGTLIGWVMNNPRLSELRVVEAWDLLNPSPA